MNETRIVAGLRGWVKYLSLVAILLIITSGVYLLVQAIASDSIQSAIVGLLVLGTGLAAFVFMVRYKLVVTDLAMEATELRNRCVRFDQVTEVEMSHGKVTVKTPDDSVSVYTDVTERDAIIAHIARKLAHRRDVKFSGDADEAEASFGRTVEE